MYYLLKQHPQVTIRKSKAASSAQASCCCNTPLVVDKYSPNKGVPAYIFLPDFNQLEEEVYIGIISTDYRIHR